MRFIYLILSGLITFSAQASVNLVEKDNWKIDMSGFIETDVIHDTRRSFVETIGNAPVARPDTVDGHNGRTQMSMRNSRLAFNVMAPTVDSWKTRAYFEFDLLGFDPKPGVADNTEAGFFNNPTFRARHIYASSESNGWQFLAGQTWAMLGWQPNYFMPTIEVSPVPGMLYSRTTQLRAVKSIEGSSTTLQLAAGIMRPPQRDGNYPSLETGARLAFNNVKAAFTGGATGGHKLQPLSVGVSGTIRNFEVPSDPTVATSSETKSYMGSAIAFDVLAPIITSHDGKSVSNNLVVGGEATMGTGYGDQFTSWSGNMVNPLNSSAAAGDPQKNVNLDAGIGGFEDSGFALVKLQTWNVYAQYHLPEHTKMWISAGYSQLYSSNIGAMNLHNGTKVAYNKEEAFFANVNHDCTEQIRVGFEYAHINTGYVDGVKAEDGRFQFSTWFIF